MGRRHSYNSIPTKKTEHRAPVEDYGDRGASVDKESSKSASENVSEREF